MLVFLSKISVFNLGGGLEKPYNKTLQVADQKSDVLKYKPAVRTVIRDEKQLKDYLKPVVLGNLFGTTKQNVDRALDHTYTKTVFGRPMVTTEALDAQGEIEQPIGNCIVKAYLFGMRIRIGDVAYRRLYLKILNVIFEQMQDRCGQLPNPTRVQSALAKSEVVFKGIKLAEIVLLPVFGRPKPAICKPKESKESEAELLKRLGLLFSPLQDSEIDDYKPFSHHGQRFFYKS